MIGFIQGFVLRVEDSQVLMNVKGIGYELSCSQKTMDEIKGKEMISLWAYTYVREDRIQLYGFFHFLEKKIFTCLLKVSGIGPKVALQILSKSSADTISHLIETSDKEALRKLPKIGEKKAEQIILALKGKLPKLSQKTQDEFVLKKDIISALVNLGFKKLEVEKVVDSMEEASSLEEGVKKGLQSLSQMN